MGDWQAFLDALAAIARGVSPYTVPYFYSPPWLLLFIFPLAWLPDLAVHFVPLAALGFAAHKKRQPYLIPIVGFSVPFIKLMSDANIEWVAMLGTLSFGYVPAVALSVKPQAAGLALIGYLRRDRVKYLVPLAALAIAGYALWQWPIVLADNNPAEKTWNISAVQYTWPIGLYGLWRCWRKSDLMWGCVASLALSPYFSMLSLVPTLFLVASRHKRVGILLSSVSWVWVAG
jgi:hypothetical protein